MIRLSGRLVCADAAQAARVAAALPEHVRLSRAAPGCLRFDVTRDASDPLVWRVEELFVDRAAFAAHQARAAGSAWAEASAGAARDYRIEEIADPS